MGRIGNAWQIILIGLFLAAPQLAFAAGLNISGNPFTIGISTGRFSGLFGTGLASSTNLMDLIVGIIYLLLFFAGTIAVLFVVIGGFWYLTSGGNEETAEKGRKTVTNAIIGIIIVVMSYAIIRVIQNTLIGPSVYISN